MGSGGTEWDSNDVFDQTRMNQKTRFVGNATQATNLITSTQAGQIVFPTDTDATFTKADKTFVRNSANSAWLSNVHTKATYTDGAGTGSNYTITTYGAGIRHYSRFLTLPSTYDFYIITSFTFRAASGATGGSFMIGCELVDADPPTKTSLPLVAWSTLLTLGAGAGETSYTRKASSKVLRAGDIIGIFVMVSSGVAALTISGLGTSNNSTRNTGYSSTPALTTDVAWVDLGSIDPDIKITAEGFN